MGLAQDRLDNFIVFWVFFEGDLGGIGEIVVGLDRNDPESVNG